MLEKKIHFTDSVTEKRMKWVYSIGPEEIFLEGRILCVENEQLKIALAGVWPEDIQKTRYLPYEKTFTFYVKIPQKRERCHSVTQEIYYYIPLETKTIRIYGLEVGL